MINLKRENVKDYQKSLYEDLKGKIPIQDLIILEVWNALFWIDNKVYHLIGSGEAIDKSMEANRTVLLSHYPTFFTLTGRRNTDNNLDTNLGDKDLKIKKFQ